MNEKPVNKIYKATPDAPAEKDENTIKILKEKEETNPASTDSIVPSNADLVVPSDSISNSIQDTTETLQHMEKKTEIKVYKKIYLHNIHRKPPVS